MTRESLVHILGGGFNQIPIVQKAKDLGLRVLVSDCNEDPPCRALADLYERIDTTDREATLAAALKHKIDYVTTDQTDVAVPTVAYVAERMGLKGVGYKTALQFANKRLTREALRGKLDEHMPESRYFEDPQEAIRFCRDAANPSGYLVKPTNSQGSKGVFVLESSYEEKIAASFTESSGHGVLIERYIDGSEYSVETFVKDRKVYNLTVTKKDHYRHNPCLDERNSYLAEIDPALERQLFEVNEKVIKVLDLSFGNTHAEYIVSEGRVYLMEIAARGAGGSINSKIIPFLTGFDPVEGLLKTLTDRPLDIEIGDYKKKFAVLKFFNFKPGRIKTMHLNRELIDRAMVFVLDVADGDTIRAVQDSRDRPGYFIVHGEDREEVMKRERLTESAVQIEYY
jgi:biotin carboxylase